MPQDSSFISHSTEGSSAGRLSENQTSKKQAIVPDMAGNFFVMKQTIDVPKYHKWLVTEQPKPSSEEEAEEPLPFLVENHGFISKEDVEEMNKRRKQLNTSAKKADKGLMDTFFGVMTCSTHVKVHTR